jgi:DNA-binding PadR family transcriptional regulator
MFSKELLKGTLSAIILKLLADNGKMHGYRITQIVKQLSDNKILIKEGSLYPALHKLEEDGLVDIETEYIGKRIRHHYFLTEKGFVVKEEKEKELLNFIETIKNIINYGKIN